MILGLASMIAANAACLLATHAVWKRCRTGAAPADAALFLLIRFAIATSTILLSGSAGFLNGPALGLAGAATLGALLLGGAHRDVRLTDFRVLHRAIPPLLLGTAGFFLVRLLLQVWFLSPSSGDAISYHLPKVAEWIQAGRITAETGVAYRTPFPGGFELFEIWWCVFLHHDLLIELAGVEAWCLAFAALYAIARWTGLDRHGAFLASLLFGATPVVLMQAVSGLNDLPVVALYLAAAALVLFRAHPLLLLLPVGLGLGVKPTLGFALPGLLILAFLVRRQPPAAKPDRRAMGTLAVMALGAGSYWYLRNWVLYDNPIFPASQGSMFEEYMVQQVGPSLSSLKENLRRLVDSRMYDSLRGYNPQCELAANWGPAAFAVGLPGLLLGLRQDSRLRILAVGFGVSTCSVLLMVISDWWYTRFVLFVPALLSIAAARLGVSLRGISLVLAAAIGYAFIGTLATDRVSTVGELPRMVRQGWRQRASDLLGESFPKGERRMASIGKGEYDYLLYGPDFSRRVYYLRTEDPREIVSEMRRRDVRVVRGSGMQVSCLQEAVKLKLLRPIGGNFFSLPEWSPSPTSPSGRP